MSHAVFGVSTNNRRLTRAKNFGVNQIVLVVDDTVPRTSLLKTNDVTTMSNLCLRVKDNF